MKRSAIKKRRSTPRTRLSPRWSAEEWEVANHLLMRRCQGCCELCGLPLAGRCERHHRSRRRDGGDRLCNILMLHPECHARTTTNPEWARQHGYIVSAWADPAEVPVRRGGHAVLLDDSGGWRVER